MNTIESILKADSTGGASGQVSPVFLKKKQNSKLVIIFAWDHELNITTTRTLLK